MDIFIKKFGTLDLDLDPPTYSLGQSPKYIRFFDTFPYSYYWEVESLWDFRFLISRRKLFGSAVFDKFADWKYFPLNQHSNNLRESFHLPIYQ